MAIITVQACELTNDVKNLRLVRTMKQNISFDVKNPAFNGSDRQHDL
jgi:hypothetical protein